MCYEMANDKLLEETFECGPSTTNTSIVKEENDFIQAELSRMVPQLSQEAAVFRPAWININGIRYKCNNAFLLLETDGMDPVFGHLDDILVVGGSFVVYCVSLCITLYFEDHYHSYVIEVTSVKKLLSALWDHNVYHAHQGQDKKLYVTLKYLI